MSFFNLTQLGAQDTIKSSVQPAPNTSAASNGTRTSVESSRFGDSVLPNSEASGSYQKYTAMLQKHQRSLNGKNTRIYNNLCIYSVENWHCFSRVLHRSRKNISMRWRSDFFLVLL